MRSNQEAVQLATPIVRNHYSPQLSMGNHQLVIISQLLQTIGNMRHIDDLFLWLIHTLSQRLSIDVIQFWTLQNHAGAQTTIELRAMVSPHPGLPLHVVVNPDVVGVIRQVLKERSGQMPLSVASIFSQDQTNLLTRHNLHYWTCYFLCNSSLLPPVTGKNTDTKKVSTPLVMVASLFMQQAPSQRLLPTIGHILEQAILIAKKRGLLLVDGKRQLLPLLPPSSTVQGRAEPYLTGIFTSPGMCS